MVNAGLTPEQFLGDNRFIQAFVNTKDYQTALNILNERLKIDPKNTNTLSILAGLYAEMKNNSKAIETLKKIIEIDPNFKQQGEAYIKELSK